MAAGFIAISLEHLVHSRSVVNGDLAAHSSSGTYIATCSLRSRWDPNFLELGSVQNWSLSGSNRT